jgi:hypothetical protein
MLREVGAQCFAMLSCYLLSLFDETRLSLYVLPSKQLFSWTFFAAGAFLQQALQVNNPSRDWPVCCLVQPPVVWNTPFTLLFITCNRKTFILASLQNSVFHMKFFCPLQKYSRLVFCNYTVLTHFSLMDLWLHSFSKLDSLHQLLSKRNLGLSL